MKRESDDNKRFTDEPHRGGIGQNPDVSHPAINARGYHQTTTLTSAPIGPTPNSLCSPLILIKSLESCLRLPTFGIPGRAQDAAVPSPVLYLNLFAYRADRYAHAADADLPLDIFEGPLPARFPALPCIKKLVAINAAVPYFAVCRMGRTSFNTNRATAASAFSNRSPHILKCMIGQNAGHSESWSESFRNQEGCFPNPSDSRAGRRHLMRKGISQGFKKPIVYVTISNCRGNIPVFDTPLCQIA